MLGKCGLAFPGSVWEGKAAFSKEGEGNEWLLVPAAALAPGGGV